MDGVERIAAERKRQIEKEGWEEEHDDDHEYGELAFAAACYALPDRTVRLTFGKADIGLDLTELLWPWDDDYWKPSLKNRIRELEKAGALIAAEIDRLLRKGK